MTYQLTRRAALTGATALATTAALAAPALAADAKYASHLADDSALLALCDRFQQLGVEQEDARRQWVDTLTLANRRPGFEHVSVKDIRRWRSDVIGSRADPEVAMEAERRLAEATYLDPKSGLPGFWSAESKAAKAVAQPHYERLQQFDVALLAVHAEIAATPARTPAGLLGKFEVLEHFGGSRKAMLASMRADLEALAAA